MPGIPGGSSRRFPQLCYLAVLLAPAWLTISQARAQQPTPQISPPTHQKADKSAVSGYRLPFTPLKGHGGPVVQMRVNNSIDVKLLVATGSTATVFNTELVKKLGLPIKQVTISGTPVSCVHIDSLTAEGLTLFGDFIVDDEVAHQGREHFTDGVLGSDALSHFSVLFDFEENQLLLLSGGKFSKEQLTNLGFEYGKGGAIPVSSPTPDSTEPMVTVRVSPGVRTEETRHETVRPELTYSVLLDSGSPKTILPSRGRDMRSILGEEIVVLDAHDTSGSSLIGTFSVGSLALGDTTVAKWLSQMAPFTCAFPMPSPTTVTGPNATAKSAKGEREEDALLGMDYLARHRVFLDYPERLLYLTPVNDFRRVPFPTAASRENEQLRYLDLVTSPSATGKWFVDAVTAGEPFARAGVQPGDIVIKMSGSLVEGMQPGKIIPLFYRDPKSVYLEVLRQGKTVTLEVQKPDQKQSDDQSSGSGGNAKGSPPR